MTAECDRADVREGTEQNEMVKDQKKETQAKAEKKERETSGQGTFVNVTTALCAIGSPAAVHHLMM